VHYTLENQ